MKTDLSKPLDVTERKHLKKHEAVIRHGLMTTLAVGNALAFIRDEKLYRDTHKTFPEYCRETWDFKKSRAYQLIDASATAAEMSTMVDVPSPQSERQTRPLEQLDTPEQKSEAWKEACEKHGDEPTGAQVEEVVQGWLPDDDEPPAEDGFVDQHVEEPVEDAGPEPPRRDTTKAAKLLGQLVRELDALGVAWQGMTLQEVKTELSN